MTTSSEPMTSFCRMTPDDSSRSVHRLEFVAPNWLPSMAAFRAHVPTAMYGEISPALDIETDNMSPALATACARAGRV